MLDSLILKFSDLKKLTRSFREEMFQQIKELRLQNKELKQRVLKLEQTVYKLQEKE